MASGLLKRWLAPQNQPLAPGREAQAVQIEINTLSTDDNDITLERPKNDLGKSIVEVGDEKVVPGSTISSDHENRADDDPTIRDLPPTVRRVVSLEDDPTLPTITFRFFVLSILFVIPGAFLSQLSHFRTTYAPYSVFFVQIASNYAGLWLAKVLPAWNVRIPFTSYGFNLNPGAWSVKEHVLVTICAASGATYNLAYAPVSIAELYFGQKMNAGVAIVFMWTVVWIGYSFAAISRQFLLYDPQYPWSVTFLCSNCQCSSIPMPESDTSCAERPFYTKPY